MKKVFILFFTLLLLPGCARDQADSSVSSRPDNTSVTQQPVASFDFSQAVVAVRNGQAFLWDGTQTVLLPGSGLVTAAAFSPKERTLIVVKPSGDRFDVWLQTFSPTVQSTDEQLLFSSRFSIDYISISPLGIHVAFVQELVRSADSVTAAEGNGITHFQVAVYDMAAQQLQTLPGSGMFPSWSDDGKSLLYLDAGEETAGGFAVILQRLDIRGIFGEGQKILANVDFATFFRDDVLLSHFDDDRVLLSMYDVSQQTQRDVTELSFVQERPKFQFFQISPQHDALLWTQFRTESKSLLDTWLLPMGEQGIPRHVLPQSDRVLWYNNGTVLYAPVYTTLSDGEFFLLNIDEPDALAASVFAADNLATVSTYASDISFLFHKLIKP